MAGGDVIDRVGRGKRGAVECSYAVLIAGGGIAGGVSASVSALVVGPSLRMPLALTDVPVLQ